MLCCFCLLTLYPGSDVVITFSSGRDQGGKHHHRSWVQPPPPLSDLDGFSYFPSDWIEVFVEIICALPVKDIVLWSGWFYGWFVVSTGRVHGVFFSVRSGEFGGYILGVLLVFFMPYTELVTDLAIMTHCVFSKGCHTLCHCCETVAVLSCLYGVLAGFLGWCWLYFLDTR